MPPKKPQQKAPQRAKPEARPPFEADDAVDLAQELFGVEARATELVSYDDRNFLLIEPRTGERSVLKIQRSEQGPAPSNRDILEAETQVLGFLERAEPAVPCPRLLLSQNQQYLEWVTTGGEAYGVRRITWLQGRHLAAVPHSPELLGHLGSALAQLDNALERAREELDLQALERRHEWDLEHAPAIIGARIGAIQHRAQRACVEALVDRYVADSFSRVRATRRGLIHCDINEYNVLVTDPASGPERFEPRSVTAILDFGDLVVTHAVSELAVAFAYMSLFQENPLTDLGPLVAAFHRIRPLREEEIAVIFPLALMRLCLSVTQSAQRLRLDPENDYVGISERAAWRTLLGLRGVHPGRVEWLLRQACGLEPGPGSHRVQNAIAAAAQSPATAPAPVLGFALSEDNTHILDSSLASPLFESVQGLAPTTDPNEEPGATTAILSEAVRQSGKKVGWGRWNEARPFYGGDQFASAGVPARTVHLGVDLASEPGTAIYAPLDAIVHSVADNNHPGDYGPTVLLEHRLPVASDRSLDQEADGQTEVRFLTLYGHLQRQSIAQLEPGQKIGRGQQLATIGSAHENGGWWPHLHFQLIVDVLDYSGDFPGVAAPEERQAWLSVSPDPANLLGFQHPVASRSASDNETGELLGRRQRSLPSSLSLSYRKPLHIVRGEGQWLYDALGHRFLDLVNNVCHIGHCHPAVVRAVSQQMALLNTNTRYLHRNLLDYAERLAATFPDPLEVCFLVNSGSEANDLALRIARAVTGHTGVICLEGAYHGHLSSLIDISPYKHDGPGGAGTPAGVLKAPIPDVYRGRHRGPDAAARYIQEIQELIERHSTTDATNAAPAAFFAESLLSCGGQVVLPEGYLEAAYRAVRKAGGLCVADEVQVGFARVGSHFWGFETQGVVPDLVTLGKPIGNGHPLAAVVTTREIADAFAASGMEYFNTYGGNPVSCAAGLAVLDTIEKEGLQQHAEEVGSHLLQELQKLAQRHSFLGDVRGRGLFLGIELIDPKGAANDPRPDADLATFVVEQMQQRGFLLSTDGPDHNVIKIKPPLVIGRDAADSFLDQLGLVLGVVAGTIA